MPLADVPLEHEPGLLWLKATLVGRPIDALLDSGAGSSVMDDRLGKQAGAIRLRRLEVGGNGPGMVVGWESRGLDATLDNTPLTTPIYNGLPLRNLFPDFGHPADAILGFEFFYPRVVEIDYAASRLRVYEPKSYRPPPGFETLTIQFVDRIPTVEGTLRLPGVSERRATVAFDTGSEFGVDVENRMVRREKLERSFSKVETLENSGGLGGVQRTRAAGTGDVRLGGLVLSGAARLMMTKAPKIRRPFGLKYDSDVTLGDAVLRNYTVVFDYPRSRLYLKPNGPA